MIPVAMYFCLNRGSVKAGSDYESFVAAAAAGGFDGCDLDAGYAAQRGAAATADLFAGHHLRFGGWGLGDWRGTDAAAADHLAKLPAHAAVARALDADTCATWIMPSSDRTLTENWRFHVERLAPVARVLADHGLRLGLEFVAPYHLRAKFAHEFAFTPGQMLELAGDVGPNVGLLVDAFHLHCAGVPMSALERLTPRQVVLCHINDAPRIPVYDVQDGTRLLPGEGAIDLGGFLGGLATIGYAGPVSMEVFSDELRALDPAEAARRGAEACKRVAGMVPSPSGRGLG